MEVKAGSPVSGATGRPRSRGYLTYLVVLMGLVAVMDQYLSTIRSTAIPYVLQEYKITAPQFSWLEMVYLIPTFLIFLLNGLNDLIGRRLSILILVLLMGLSSLGILLVTPSIHLFMIFYAMAIFTTVSNMWAIPPSEEAPAATRANTVAIVYVIGLIPLQALLPPLLISRLGLNWRWMYGVMALFMVVVLVCWLWMRETQRFEVIRRERQLGSRRSHFFGIGTIDRRDVKYIVFSASIWMCWLINQMLFNWAGHYFMDVKGYTLGRWSLVLLGTLVMAMIAGLTGGRIMDRLGRRTGLLIGCAGLSVTVACLGIAPSVLQPAITALAGFFSSLAYSWIMVYIPEIFPTDRRGACMGWTTTGARISYVAAPALSAVLLQASPTMEWFWVAAGAVMLVPLAIVLLLKPYETRAQELEEIEARR